MSAQDAVADALGQIVATWIGTSTFDFPATRAEAAQSFNEQLRAAGYAVVLKKITDATCALALGNKPHSILLARAIWDALILAAEEECK